MGGGRHQLMIMKRIFFLTMILLLSLSCAKTETVSSNAKSKRHFDAWLQTYCKEAWDNGAKGFGYYLTPSKELAGAGDPVADSAWVYVRYTSSDMNGNITGSTEESVNRQLGTYVKSKYYGPTVLQKSDPNAVNAGMRSFLSDMRIGGKRQAIIPGWLNVLKNLATAEEYFNSTDGAGAALVYDLEILDATNNMTRWGVDSLVRYVSRHPSCPHAKSDVDVPAEEAKFVRCSEESKDTTDWGYWYQRLRMSDEEKKLPNDTTVYLDYIGRRLDGQVFDTNIKDTARKYDIYSSSATYAPMQIKLAEYYYDIKSISASDGSANSLIRGFSYTIKHMQPGEWGVALFHQGMGYAASAQTSIPAYSPLMFEMRLVEKP